MLLRRVFHAPQHEVGEISLSIVTPDLIGVLIRGSIQLSP